MHLKVELCIKILMFASDSLLFRMSNGPLYLTLMNVAFFRIIIINRNQRVFNLTILEKLVIAIHTASYWLAHSNPPV